MSKKKASQRKANKETGAINSYLNRARTLSKENQPETAIQVYKQAIGLSPSNPTPYLEIGKLQVKGKLLKEGIENLEKAVYLSPKMASALVELGQAYMKNNDLEKSLSTLKETLEIAPNSPAVHVAYGSINQRIGELPKAVDSYKEALRLRLNYPTKKKEHRLRTDFGKQSTEELLWDTLSLLAKSGVHAFASYGTLLGLVRDGELLPFDKDLDFGLPQSEMENACQCLERNGWVPLEINNLINPRAFFHPVKKVSLDLSGFVVDPKTGDTFTGFWMSNIPYEWSRNTKYIDIELYKDESPTGQPIWSLVNPEAWLEVIYGDWKTPDPYFDTVIAAKNLCGFSLLTQCYAYSRVFSHWEKGNLRKALATTEHSQQHLPNDELLNQVTTHLNAALHDK
ncbi:tetratricopeptide repeat protein [Chromohalobacter beijerinckii]|uniref:Tetratricopeptide repeat protein n=1 Tax=Chromohalobacter beijerinckii TaxID=86179 RepID=A0ABV8XG10_9GAMM|nr:tetratricopeptide repeat protein [Chromohalobacter beijerinckii]MCK0766549.1 tetratricopeptide repeat protein [Chromohalobacter beijerinckii]